MSQPEAIVAAAIQYDGVTFSLPRPARHGQVMHCLQDVLGSERLAHACQGFLTSDGRFVNRVQARQIAHAAGQNPGHSGGDTPDLYSEDLW